MASGAGPRTSNQQASPGGDDWLACAKSAMSLVVSSLTEAPFGLALESIEDFRGELNALEALLMAQRKRAGFSERSTETIMKRSGKVSKGEAKKRTKRSNAIDENPELAKKMSDGDISTEQVDLLAEASDKTEGDAANDPELIEEITNSNPDQGKKVISKYIDDHTSQSDRDARYAYQRKRRKVRKSRGANGMPRLIIEGDDHSIDRMLNEIRRQADGLYRKDGGRDVPNSAHQRTNDQRLYDAAFEQITGRLDDAPSDENDQNDIASPSPDMAEPDGSAGPAQGNEDGTASPNLPAPAGSSRSKPRSKQGGNPTPPANKPGERPIMVFRSDISSLSDDPELLAEWKTELLGSGIVPSTLASYYRCISDFAVQLVDGDGIVLKHGRTKRRATPEQWVALVARDESCVNCGAHHTRCEAHHLKPWTSPAKGETNVDDMVLVCVDCHHRLHAANHTLEFAPLINKWVQRPATWDETPAPGPKKSTRRRTKPERADAKQRRKDRALANW